MAVDDQGMQVLVKAAEEVTPGDKSEYYIKVGIVDDSSTANEPTDGDNITTVSQGRLLIGTTDVPGTARAVITDDDGHLQIDVLSSALPTGAARDATVSAILADTTTMDANLAILAAVDFATETTLAAILLDTAGMDVNLEFLANYDFATQTTLAAILADTAAMDSNLSTIAGAVVAGQMQSDIVAALPTGTNSIGAVTQATHDNFNANANLQIGDADVTDLNPVPVTSPQPDGEQGTNLTSTTETTIITAAASTYHDITELELINRSAISVDVDIREDTGASVKRTIPLAPKAGIVLRMAPWKQTNVNDNWTAQLSDADGDVEIWARWVDRT